MERNLLGNVLEFFSNVNAGGRWVRGVRGGRVQGLDRQRGV
jgi:hypothetical protein